ncbi:CBS domain-containing protein [Candidatus Bathyarchaeota archaeon]|nr:CBS domain-containing protein [Candidatus Bathyarchaeota archaeon]
MAGLISVKDVMTKDVKVVRTDTSMQEVVATMIKFDISSVVVVQKDRPVGLITHKDILTKVLKPGFPTTALTARQVMSRPVITIKEETSVDEAAKLMARKGFKKLPVVQDGKLVGIVTSMDLIREQPRIIELFEDLLKASAS